MGRDPESLVDVNRRRSRPRIIADPRTVLAAAGLALPDWFTVTASEGDAPELAITLPPLLDDDAELSDEHLAAVSGGCEGCHYRHRSN